MIESDQFQPKSLQTNFRNTPLNKGAVIVPNRRTDFSKTPNLVKNIEFTIFSVIRTVYLGLFVLICFALLKNLSIPFHTDYEFIPFGSVLKTSSFVHWIEKFRKYAKICMLCTWLTTLCYFTDTPVICQRFGLVRKFGHVILQKAKSSFI